MGLRKISKAVAGALDIYSIAIWVGGTGVIEVLSWFILPFTSDATIWLKILYGIFLALLMIPVSLLFVRLLERLLSAGDKPVPTKQMVTSSSGPAVNINDVQGNVHVAQSVDNQVQNSRRIGFDLEGSRLTVDHLKMRNQDTNFLTKDTEIILKDAEIE
jgi:hypothetical protein